jgi:hypothetical protein
MLNAKWDARIRSADITRSTSTVRVVAMKTKKIKCLVCGARVTDSFRSRWRHVASRHPEIVIEKILPLISNPDSARNLGAAFGSWIRSRLNA